MTTDMHEPYAASEFDRQMRKENSALRAQNDAFRTDPDAIQSFTWCREGSSQKACYAPHCVKADKPQIVRQVSANIFHAKATTRRKWGEDHSAYSRKEVCRLKYACDFESAPAWGRLELGSRVVSQLRDARLEQVFHDVVLGIHANKFLAKDFIEEGNLVGMRREGIVHHSEGGYTLIAGGQGGEHHMSRIV